MSDRAAVQPPCPWHREHTGELLQQYRAQRLAHALLFAGPAGTGKRRFARALVEALLCEQPTGGLACGRCRGCHLAVAGSHPDLFLLEPEEAGKAIPVDRIRELVDFASRTPQFGGARLALLHPAEAMLHPAQNALLKTLEEPGPDMILVLVSHRPASLLPTIRSRCRQHVFPIPDPEPARQWLEEELGESGGEVQALLAAAGGAPLRARELAETPWFQRRRELLQALVRVAESPRAVPEAARLCAEMKLDAVVLVEAAWGWTARALRQLAGVPAGRHQDTVLAPLLARLAEVAGEERLLAFSRQLLRARRMLASGSNPNAELLREQLLLALAGVDASPADI